MFLLHIPKHKHIHKSNARQLLEVMDVIKVILDCGDSNTNINININLQTYQTVYINYVPLFFVYQLYLSETRKEKTLGVGG